MKKLLILPILLLLIISCSKSSTSDVAPDYTNNHPELIGKWQYAEYLGFDSTGMTSGPYLITNGFTITFNSNGTFTSTEIADHPNGTFLVSSSNQITLTYNSPTLGSINKVKEILSISGNGAVLNPIPVCYEGCAERYEKVTTP